MRRNPPHGKGTTTHSADYAAPERKWQIKTQPSCAANPPYMGEILYAVRGTWGKFYTPYAVAEFERELIAERTQAGLAAARARGRKGGRPRKMDRPTLMMAMTALADPKANAAAVAKRLGVTTTTLYAYVNGDGTVKAAGQAIINKDIGV